MKENIPKVELIERPVFVWALSVLIIYSVVCFSVETLPDLSAETTRFLELSEIVVISIFTVEYLCRILCARNKIKFVFSFYGLVDLITILPFYLAFAIDLRAMRLVRLLRLVRIIKLARYNRAINRFSEAIYIAKEELIIFTLASMIMIYLAAAGIYYFEHAAQPEIYRSIFDCLWWAVVTLTTVGYGDIYPVTAGGRLFTFLTLMIGLGLLVVPTGIVTSALSAVRNNQEGDLK
jgi:voltage-gated potassium channel